MSASAEGPVTQIPLQGTRGQWHVGAKLRISPPRSQTQQLPETEPGSDFTYVVNYERLLGMRHSSGLPSTCITASKACLHGRGGASEIILHKAVFFFFPSAAAGAAGLVAARKGRL